MGSSINYLQLSNFSMPQFKRQILRCCLLWQKCFITLIPPTYDSLSLGDGVRHTPTDVTEQTLAPVITHTRYSTDSTKSHFTVRRFE